jgi:hypothetical protein
MKAIAPNLRTLNVIDGGDHWDPLPLDFLAFTNLKHLSVPAKDFVLEGHSAPTSFLLNELADVSFTLPRSLESLRNLLGRLRGNVATH